MRPNGACLHGIHNVSARMEPGESREKGIRREKKPYTRKKNSYKVARQREC